jgi:hypothetical protein
MRKESKQERDHVGDSEKLLAPLCLSFHLQHANTSEQYLKLVHHVSLQL